MNISYVAARRVAGLNRRARTAVSIAAAVLTTACGGASTAPTSGPISGREVDATPAIAFTPSAVTIHAGDTVTFSFGNVAHNVFFDAAAGAPADIPGTNAQVNVQRVFSAAGTYRYNCHIHPGMSGTITVQAPAGSSLILRAAAGQPSPAIVDRDVQAGSSVDLYVVSDTLTLDATTGTYRQSAHFEARVGDKVIGLKTWFDKGHFTRDGSMVYALSDYLEFVTFNGTFDDAGVFRINQDLAGNGVNALYEFVPGK